MTLGSPPSSYILMLYGIFLILAGAALNGIWIAAIGWFLQNAANASMQQMLFEVRMGDIHVAHVGPARQHCGVAL